MSLPSTTAPSIDQLHQQPASSPGTSNAGLPAAQQLPELHALKLLAQALLEAHVELAVKQSQPPLPPPQQPASHPQQLAAAGQEACSAPAPASAETLRQDAPIVATTCASGAASSSDMRHAAGAFASGAGPLPPSLFPASVKAGSLIEAEAVYDEGFLAMVTAVESMVSAATQGLCGSKMQETQGLHCYEENDLLDLISIL